MFIAPKPAQYNEPWFEARTLQRQLLSLAHLLSHADWEEELNKNKFFNERLAKSKTADISTIRKLMINAWNTEYLLALNQEVAKKSGRAFVLHWAFPQAYFAVLFSARAVLAVDGIYLANPEVIEKLLIKWARQGLYGPKITNENNPLSDVIQYRIKGNQRLQRLSGPEAAALHLRLTETVYATAIIHETHILNRMGADAYRLLIKSLPQYLKDGFVGARAISLLN